ncbi:hypothetical protein AWB80_01427 [Caballeronia pedi]|uniref:Polysaccharide biosynthesis protein n=2 Tax=Caballeronia pedi TaxID=1777141 RepID=A0A157ZXX5_9BURK|nr:hypothetical protein AWB80_01427 [Caballeronia pedi]
MLKWRSWLGRVEALICTGMPGLYRVVVFASVQRVYSTMDLGLTASCMSLAQLAAFFSGIGWASLILVRVPMAADRRQAIDSFYSAATMAGTTAIAVCCASFVVAAVSPSAIDASSFALLLCGWSMYQLARHYFVACKSYRVAVLFDFALIGCSYVALCLCRAHGVPASAALAYALLAVSFCMFGAIGAPSRAALDHRFDVKGLQSGMTGFLSSGVNLLFVPIASLTCGAEFAGGFSLLSSITAVAVLLPRAVSMTQLPELAKLVASNKPIQSTLQTMHRTVRGSNGGVLGLNVVLVAVVVYSGADGINFHYRNALIIAGLLLSMQYAVAMSSAVPSNVMMLFEKAGAVARVNIKTTFAFAVACALLVWLGGTGGFLSVLAAAVVTAAIRNGLIAKLARRASESYARKILVL